MLDLPKLQQEIFENKISKGFNTTDINLEFCYAYGELAEAFESYLNKSPEVGEELADVFIYVSALAKMLNVDLEKEILKKIEKNKRRQYQMIDGVLVRKKEA
ncbi:MAG: MazG-like family protein [Patescibacteria group bacterium]|jgi:uncharacterized protein YabN with tetrapyrrole methylase and pyrophosphatase domain